MADRERMMSEMAGSKADELIAAMNAAKDFLSRHWPASDRDGRTAQEDHEHMMSMQPR
jgi:hypothetical protein